MNQFCFMYKKNVDIIGNEIYPTLKIIAYPAYTAMKPKGNHTARYT